MKQYTSRFLKTVACGYLAFPLVYFLVAAVLFNIPAHFCLQILLSPSFYLLSIVAVTTGYGLWEMRRWAWYVFVAANLMIGYENLALLSQYGDTHNKGLTFGVSVVILFLLVYRVAREIRVPYFFPKIRWWESNPRYRLSVPVWVSRSTGEPIEAQILDLSMGGCFVKVRSAVTQDEAIHVKFTVFGCTIECSGVIVWCTQSTVTHPRGIGVKFDRIPRPVRRNLKGVVRRLKKIAAFYRRSRYLMNQDEFMKRLEELESQKPIKIGRPEKDAYGDKVAKR
jgi:uncharacterized membrane protein (DUF2068 family)